MSHGVGWGKLAPGFGVLVLAAGVLAGQQPWVTNRYIENPRMFGENREPPHVSTISFASRSAALRGDPGESEAFASLDGSWSFQWHQSPETVVEGFHRRNFDVSGWDRIQVPGTWQMQGYDHVIYRNVGEDFTPWDPPHVPDSFNPVGCYVRDFEIPRSWAGKQVFLNFEGVKSAYSVWVNGAYVGYAQDSMTQGEFNVSRFLQPGPNRLAVQVIRWSDGSYLEDQDMWRFSGIYRSVFLYAKPAVSIRDFAVRTDLDEEYRDAELRVDAEIANLGGAAGAFRLRGELVDAQGQTVGLFETEMAIERGPSKAQARLAHPVAEPAKWTAETPHLYRLLLSLEDGEGSVLEFVTTRVGFREIEVRNRQVLINGVPVEFKGVNRHEHHPRSGRTVPRETMVRDLELMKQFNINAVRLSHYPNDPRWYELTDEYGIYLVDEVNAECHGDERLSEDPAWTGAFVDRFSRMLERDKNHPSVILWSTGNECGLGVSSVAMARYAKDHDPSRLLFHQGNARGGLLPNGDAPYADVNGIRYPSPSELRDHAATCPKPVVMGEYSHALANSCGHLDEYWELIFEEPTLQGGFIWDWVDQSLEQELTVVPDQSGNGNFGAFLGRPGLVDGKVGKAVDLSGIDDWVEVYTGPSLDLAEEITLDLWVFPRAWHGHNPLLSRSEHFTLEQSGEKTLEFAVYTPSKLRVEMPVPTDWEFNWHHLSATFDGRELVLAIDEQVVRNRLPDARPLGLGESLPLPGTRMTPSQYPLNVGRNWWENHENFQGWISNSLIDEVRIYPRALSLDELNNPGVEDIGGEVLWLSFDSVKKGDPFLSYGATPWASGTLDGIVFADRTPQPEAWQVKKSQAPVKVEPVDLRSGRLRITNRFDFTDLGSIPISWKVTKDGEPRDGTAGIMLVPLPPHQSMEVDLELGEIDAEPGRKYFLELQFRTARDWPGLPAGHEVAFEQFELPVREVPVPPVPAPEGSLAITESAGRIEVEGPDFAIAWGLETGRLESFRYQGQELLEAGPQLNVWRAPILNEISIWNEAESQLWYAQGLNRVGHECLGVEARQLAPDRVEVTVRTRSSPPGRALGFHNRYTYQVETTGEVTLTHRAVPFGNLTWFQKLGVDFELPVGFSRIDWFGRGPFENYPDRKTGARIGAYSVEVGDDYVPYVYPQDYGNRSDVFWVAASNSAGVGLAIIAESSPVSFSVDPWENLDRAVYAFQLRRKGTVTLHVDHRVTGVGGTPINVRPRYRTYPEDYEWSIRLRPFKGGPETIRRQP